MMNKVWSFLFALALVGFCSGVSQAALIVGGSFESPDVADGSSNIQRFPTLGDGWTYQDNNKAIAYGAGVEDPATPVSGQLGDQYAKMKFIYNSNNQWIKLISPQIGEMQAGYTYTVQVAATWDRQYGGGAQPHWSGYNSVSLVVGALAFDLTTPALTQLSFTDLSFQIVLDSSGNLVSHTATNGPVVGTNLLGAQMQIKLMGGRAGNTDGNGASYLMFDNARVTVTPEPASMAILGIGGLGLLLRRRRG